MLKILLLTLLFRIKIDTVIIKTPKGDAPVRTSPDRAKIFNTPYIEQEQILRMIKDNLRVLQKNYITRIPGELNRQKATALIFEIEDLVNVLYLNFFEFQEEEAKPEPMDENGFQKLLEQINREWNTQNRLSVLEIAAKTNYFTTSQVARIMRTFYRDDDKIEVVKITIQKIIDQENLYLLISELTFSSSKEELKKILRN